MSDPSAHDLQPIRASLVADLVDLVNLDLSKVVKVALTACPACKGHGTIGDRDEGQDVTCPECGGVGAAEAFVLDMDAIKTPRIGRHVEQWEYKQGQLIPKFRAKSAAFAQLSKILGFDKAVLEIAQSATFTETLSEESRAQYIEQVRELALAGKL
ncbi:integrase [Xanthomonas phage XPP9]|nr:integrase [Xanthomonas phage XPP9]